LVGSSFRTKFEERTGLRQTVTPDEKGKIKV
jgi:hypothetical protein